MAEEWDVFALPTAGDVEGDVYADLELLGTLYQAYDKQFRVELDGTGVGSFSINRSSPHATETTLAQGNLVRVRVPEISDDYIFAFFLETGDFNLISSDEDGGERLSFGGRGGLSYLEYARATSESFIDGGMSPIAGLWNAYLAGTGSKPGQILRRMIEEFQHPDREHPPGSPSQPVPLLTIDFDYDDDSSGDTWDSTDATDEFKYQVGEDGLAIAQRLWETETITLQMDPTFLLHAYNRDNFGRDLTGDAFGAGVVRFERGINIATELRRTQAETRVVTHNLVSGEADQYGGAVLADASDRVTKEGYVAYYGTSGTTLDAFGAVDLQSRLRESDIIEFPINNRRTEVSLDNPITVGSVRATPGVATDGFYLPGPEGTNGDFWVGDLVRVHTGNDSFDYSEVDALVRAITIARNNDNAELDITVELKTQPPVIEPFAILYRPQTVGINPGQTKQIGWVCSGDPQPCSVSTYGVRPTVGPLEPTAGSLSGKPDVQYLGLTFTGTGTFSFTSAYQLHTACSLQTVYVDILLDGVVVASNFVQTTGGTGNPLLHVNGTDIAVTAGQVLTAQARHVSAACTITIDGVNERFEITGGSLA